MDIEFDEFESVPLPDKVPMPINPPQDSQSLKSRTVQTLLNQNQDLMARLTVALKRNIELEQKGEAQEEAFQRLQVKTESLQDQADIHIEKSKRMEFEFNRMMDENTSLEKKFAELYTAYQDKIGHIQNLSYRLHRFLKYKKKIRFLVRPFIQNMKFKIESLHHESINLKEELYKKNELISELKVKLQEAFDHIQAITQNFEKDQSQLVNYHETRFNEISSKFQALIDSHSLLNTKFNEQKKIIEELKENEASLENKSIYYERKYSDLETEHNQLSHTHASEKRTDGQRIQILESQLQDLSQKHVEAFNQKNKLQQENQTLSDQLQSLQLLYQDNHQRTEDLKKIIEAQEQMNKDLSLVLSEQRKRSDTIELKLYEAEEEFKRKLQSFQMRFYKKNEEGAGSNTPPAQMNQKDLLDKIQSLLSETQTGQPKAGLAAPHHLMSENGEIES